MISVLPQLPCKNRYTEDWIEVWARGLVKEGLVEGADFEIFGHDIPTQVTKFFTNPEYALRYECFQIKALSQKDHLDRVLCLDVEFPGLISPAIQVLRLINPGLKAYGYLHAGSWCTGDVWSKTTGRYYLDRMIFDTFDKVFVATNYHAAKIHEYFEEEIDNIAVVGFPFYAKDVYAYVKPIPFEEKKTVLVNGRREQSSVEFLTSLEDKLNVDIYWISADNRKEYYEQLNRAKVVISLKTEETFGIGQLEAYALGGIPLCPNKFAYPEVIGDKGLLYSSEDDLVDKLEYLLGLDHNPFYLDIEKYEQTIARCVRMIK